MGSVVIALGFWFCLLVIALFALALYLDRWDDRT